MQGGLRIVWILLCIVVLSTACSTDNSDQSSATSASSSPNTEATRETEADAPPTPTEVAAFAADTIIGGVDVGGLERAEAAAELEESLESVLQPLELIVDDETFTLDPADLDAEIAIDAMLDEAWSQQEQQDEEEIALDIRFDEDVLRQQLAEIAEETATPARLELITDTETISRSFAYVPAQSFDVDYMMRRVENRLMAPQATRRIVLQTHEDPNAAIPRPDSAELERQINIVADDWEGIVGLYLQDLESGETITRNADTVFSSASVIKVAILMYAYTTIPEFDTEVQEAINAMIINSDNLKANDVLAATVEGTGTDAAYDGVLAMTDFLQQLGFEHTYMNMPFEAYDYLVGLRGLSIAQGPPQEGSPPYTRPDPILRTTPAEISRIFLMIEDCSQGEGALLERYPDQITARQCQELLDLLVKTADKERLVAGIPPGIRVEHKSGWTQFMHADAGIVRSPGGDYLLTIYLWRDVEELPDVWANPYIEALSRVVYTAYNPVKLNE